MDATRYFQLASNRSLPGPLSPSPSSSPQPSSAASNAASRLVSSISAISVIALASLPFLCL